MIQSCLVAFNSMTLKKYLRMSWKICRTMAIVIDAFTVVHTCSAHMTKNLFPEVTAHINKEEVVERSHRSNLCSLVQFH